MDQKSDPKNSASGNTEDQGRRITASFQAGTHLNLPFYGQSTDSIVVYVLTIVVFFFLAWWNRYLVVVKDRLEYKIITARALQALGRVPLRRRRAIFKARLSPLPRLMRINRGNSPRAQEEPIEMPQYLAERLGGVESSTDNPSPIETTSQKTVSYYIWMRAFVEVLRALLAFVLTVGLMGLNIGLLCAVLGGTLVGEVMKGLLHAPA